MRASAHRTGNFPDRHLFRGRLKAFRIAAIFRVPVGDFQPEGDGLGVDAVRAPDFGRVFEFPGALFEDFAEARDVLLDQLRCLAYLQRLRRVHHVVGGKAVMQPAGRLGIADRLLHGDGEGDHVMAHFGFDLVDACHVDARPFAQLRGGLFRHDARFGKRLGGGQLDLQPLLEFVFLAPDAAHLRTCVARDHAGLRDSWVAPRLRSGQVPSDWCVVIGEPQRLAARAANSPR